MIPDGRGFKLPLGLLAIMSVDGVGGGGRGRGGAGIEDMKRPQRHLQKKTSG